MSKSSNHLQCDHVLDKKEKLSDLFLEFTLLLLLLLLFLIFCPLDYFSTWAEIKKTTVCHNLNTTFYMDDSIRKFMYEHDIVLFPLLTLCFWKKNTYLLLFLWIKNI